MRCPICNNDETAVIDTRDTDNNDAIKRRRECLKCCSKFTTIEKILKKEIFVIKKNGSRELFDRDRLYNAIFSSSGKRLSDTQIAEILNNVCIKIDNNSTSEIKSSVIAETVLDILERIDKISYLRFASLYMRLETFEDMNNLINKISGN